MLVTASILRNTLTITNNLIIPYLSGILSLSLMLASMSPFLIFAILPLVTQSHTKKIVTRKTISPTAVSTEPSITPSGGTRKPAIIRLIATIDKTIAMIKYLHFKIQFVTAFILISPYVKLILCLLFIYDFLFNFNILKSDYFVF